MLNACMRRLFALLIKSAVMSSYVDSIYIDDSSDKEVQCVQQNDIEHDAEEVQLLHETWNDSKHGAF
jgi:hypothetical protein